VTATCVWCNKTVKGEIGSCEQVFAKNGMLYIHQACFGEATEMPDLIVRVHQILTEGKDTSGNDDVIEFIQRMNRCKRRWEGSMKLVATLSKDVRSVNYGCEQEKLP
jgi:hypothetical protein